MNPLDQAIRAVQFLSADAVEKAGAGHPGTPMALAEVTVELFTRTLRYDPADPNWPNRDRFVLSAGHASMLLYSVLHLAGYPLSLEELRQFRQLGSATPGHPEHSQSLGIETTTGPLGQGIGNAVGLALAGKLAQARLGEAGQGLLDYRVVCLASDGDMMEGISAEASSLAGHLGLDNLLFIYDDNRITIDGPTELCFSEDVGKRYEAYGFFVQRIDGHASDPIRVALDRATAHRGSPSLIIARTTIGIGAPTKANSSKAHGAPLGAAEIEEAKRRANWPVQPDFFVPKEAYLPFQARVAENRKAYQYWQRALLRLSAEEQAVYQSLTKKELPEDLFEQLLASRGGQADATRNSAARVEQRAAELVPALIGGASDLAESTKTTILEAGEVRRDNFSGRNLHFGVREHAMAAILNGLSLSGFFIPFGSSFLIFSDYCRPAIRLSALMGQQVIYIFTHDSVFLGEDGPTHQPIEQLWSLRLIPNLDVVRPADSMECAAAWTWAMQRRNGPTVIALSRQKVPELERPSGFNPRSILDGAYVLVEDPSATITLIATGSEVHVALAAKRELSGLGHRARVVSAPCLEAFQRLPSSRREAILGAGTQRVSIEAGRSWPFRALFGSETITIGIDRFGLSAPAAHLAETFGLTGARVAGRILSEL